MAGGGALGQQGAPPCYSSLWETLCMGHMVCRVLGNILCNLDPKVKVKGKKEGICDVPLTAALVLS